MKRKLFISFDFEGLAGITNWRETDPDNELKQLATEQINAFLKGVFFSEPQAEVHIADSHAFGCNLLWTELIGNTHLIKGYPRAYYMMEGIDASFDGFVLFGYHAPIGNSGNMDHTYSASTIHQIRVNGREVDEATINMLVASHYQVPLQCVFCDNEAANWLKTNISDTIQTIVSKSAISRYAAKMEPYRKVMENLYQAGKEVFQNKGFLHPLQEQYEMEIDFIGSHFGYAAQMIPGVKKRTARSIHLMAHNPLELYRYLMTVIMVASSVKNV
jgi:D-amino peptidase